MRMNLPNIGVKHIFFVGFYAFGIQVIANIFLFFINLPGHNVFSASISWGSIIFGFVLAYFFWFSYRSMGGVVGLSEGELEVDDDTKKLLDEIKKSDFGGDE